MELESKILSVTDGRIINYCVPYVTDVQYSKDVTKIIESLIEYFCYVRSKMLEYFFNLS